MWVDKVSLVVSVFTGSSWLFVFINFCTIVYLLVWVLIFVLSWSVSHFFIFAAILRRLIYVVGASVEIIVARFSSTFSWLSVVSLFDLKVVLWFIVVSFLRSRSSSIRVDRILIKCCLVLLSRSFDLSTLSNLLFSDFHKFIIWWTSRLATALFLRICLFFRYIAPRAVMKRSIILISTFPLTLIA